MALPVPTKPAPVVNDPPARRAEADKRIRFSAPSLIGGTGRQPMDGDKVAVTGSAHNDGVWTVKASDEDWITVVTVLPDGTPGRAIQDEVPSRRADIKISEDRG